jgi:hypothetical protein
MAQSSGLSSSDKNISIPENAILEEDIIAGVNRCDIRARIRKYRDQVRWGKMRRIVVAGTPYYVPVEAKP